MFLEQVSVFFKGFLDFNQPIFTVATESFFFGKLYLLVAEVLCKEKDT
jgi:hypothetical protein